MFYDVTYIFMENGEEGVGVEAVAQFYSSPTHNSTTSLDIPIFLNILNCAIKKKSVLISLIQCTNI